MLKSEAVKSTNGVTFSQMSFKDNYGITDKTQQQSACSRTCKHYGKLNLIRMSYLALILLEKILSSVAALLDVKAPFFR